MARDQGWSLSEKGFLRIGEDGAPLTGDAAELRTFADRGRRRTRSSACRSSSPSCARTAARSRPPSPVGCRRSITLADLRGDLHSHSDWSDGTHADRGHGRGRPPARLRLPGPDRPLAVAGHRPRAHARPRRRAARDHRGAQRAVRRRGGRRDRAPGDPARAASGCSTAASWRSAPTATSTTRTTCSPSFDLVVASLHVSRRQPRAELTRRTLNAIRSPHVDVIAHPAGRMIDDPRRPRPRVGPGLCRGRADRDRARDERLAAPPRPRRRARPPGGRRRAASSRSTPTRTAPTSSTTSAGGSARRAGPGSSPRTSSTPAIARALLAWAAREAGADMTLSRTIPAMDERNARRDLALAAVTIVGLSRLLEPPALWLVAVLLLIAMLFGTLQVLGRPAPAVRGRGGRPDRVADPAGGLRGRLPRGHPPGPVRAVAGAGAAAHRVPRLALARARGADPPRPGGRSRTPTGPRC